MEDDAKEKKNYNSGIGEKSIPPTKKAAEKGSQKYINGNKVIFRVSTQRETKRSKYTSQEKKKNCHRRTTAIAADKYRSYGSIFFFFSAIRFAAVLLVIAVFGLNILRCCSSFFCFFFV